MQAFHEVKATMLGEFGVGKVKFNQLTVDSFCYDRSATANCRYILWQVLREELDSIITERINAQVELDEVSLVEDRRKALQTSLGDIILA